VKARGKPNDARSAAKPTGGKRSWRILRSLRRSAHMLAAIYNWFTEGFDTADLKDAKALLEELNG